MSKIQASSALSNLRVLDMSRVRAGPNCVRLLADFGADVVRIEPPKGVDPNEGMFAGNREGGDFQNLNRNKRAMTLNLKKPGALDIMMRLVKTADVVVENWRPDIKKKLGIDYESLAKVNPRIILASISGFGQEGPYASRPGFDQIMQGMGGLMSVTGIPGQGPVRAGLAVADMSAGLYAGIGMKRFSQHSPAAIQSPVAPVQFLPLDLSTQDPGHGAQAFNHDIRLDLDLGAVQIKLHCPRGSAPSAAALLHALAEMVARA